MLDREAGQENGGGGSRENLAMLIDAENAPPSFMDEVMRRVDRYGQVTHRLAAGSNQGEKWGPHDRGIDGVALPANHQFTLSLADGPMHLEPNGSGTEYGEHDKS